MTHYARLGVFRIVCFGLALALGIELLTIWCRFGLGLDATYATESLSTVTFGIRIHHGYVGLLLMLIAGLWTGPDSRLRDSLWITAIGLTASDLVHHFLVLWPAVGSPRFDLFYPRL